MTMMTDDASAAATGTAIETGARSAAPSAAPLAPFVLEPLEVERVWGADDLSPWYTRHGDTAIGEVWLTGAGCRVASGPLAGRTLADVARTHEAALLGERHAQASPGEFPLLVKVLFPADHLSVQVHPDDALAAAMREEGVAEVRAKSECWYALRASDGATVALGLKPGTTTHDIERTLGTVAMEPLMHHEPIAAGDMVYVDAGTVHAIGPGCVLLEVQQMSDTTYRLWDYGRPRELHLAAGRRAIKLHTAAGKVPAVPLADGATQLIATPHFIMERHDLVPASAPKQLAMAPRPECVVVLSGTVRVHSAGGAIEVARGAALIVPACTPGYALEAATGAGEGAGSSSGESAVAVRCRLP